MWNAKAADYLKNLQLFQSDLLILSISIRKVNRFQNQARI